MSYFILNFGSPIIFLSNIVTIYSSLGTPYALLTAEHLGIEFINICQQF